MNLDISQWKEFRFGRLIDDIYKAKALNKDDLSPTADIKNSIRYITRTGENNGCELLVDIHSIEANYIQKGNAITIGDTTATCFYQSESFITGDHMVVVRAEWLNELLSLYIISILNNEQYKYSYGRAFLIDRIKNTIIKLPVKMNRDGSHFIDNSKKFSDDGYVPDWQWMENYIKSLHHKPLTTTVKRESALKLKVTEWKEFKVSDVLRCDSTKLSIKDNLSEGATPFISRSAENNGCDGYVEVSADQITKGNCLTIGAEGIYSFYQSDDFATGNKVYQLRNEHMNPYVGIFLSTVLNTEDYRYSYGRARILGKLKDEIIKLPIIHNEDGSPFIDETYQYSEKGYMPDWQWMENYIKSLPYGDRL